MDSAESNSLYLGDLENKPLVRIYGKVLDSGRGVLSAVLDSHLCKLDFLAYITPYHIKVIPIQVLQPFFNYPDLLVNLLPLRFPPTYVFYLHFFKPDTRFVAMICIAN